MSDDMVMVSRQELEAMRAGIVDWRTDHPHVADTDGLDRAEGLLNDALASAPASQRGGAGEESAEAEIAKLRRDLAQERSSHSTTIDSRDRAQEAADRLAYAAFDVDDIGEHSSANCPWENAAELLEDHAGGVHELVFGPALAPADAEAQP